MKFPLTLTAHQSSGYCITDAADNEIIEELDGQACWLPSIEQARELVRRANAFDELMNYLRECEGCTTHDCREAERLLAKYEVPGSE